MSKNSSEIKVLAPYLPFQTLTSFIDKLHSTTVPPIIDTSLLPSMSGSVRSQLMSALRFLGLIDADGRVTEALRNVVKAYKTDTWKDAIRQTIADSYTDIIGDVALDSGTSSQLSDAFRKRGNVDGQMLEKAVRFYLAGLRESETTFSPHFITKKPRGTAAAGSNKKKTNLKKKGESNANNGVDTQNENEFELPESDKYAKFRIPIPEKSDAVLWLPRDIDSQDWEMVKVMLDAYVSRLTNE